MVGRLLLALLLTAIYYGLFPIIFSLVRKKPITKKKYNLLCYGINFVLMIVIQSAEASSYSAAPYAIWTLIASSIGSAFLKNKAVLCTSLPAKQATKVIENNQPISQPTIIQTAVEPSPQEPPEHENSIQQTVSPQKTVRLTPIVSPSIYCFACGKALPANSHFCQHCGMDQTKGILCPSCGTLLEADKNFCHNCGSPLKTKTAPEQQKEYNVTEGNPPKQRKKWPLLLCVCLVIAIGVGVFSWLISNQSKKPASAATNVLYLEMYDYYGELVGSASGFLVNDGITLVTNYHVIQDAYHIVATTADSSKQADVDIVLGYDEVADLAILKCSSEIGASPLPLANSDKVKQGDNVFAAGYPLGLANTLSNGIISSIYEENGIDVLQVTTAISGGSSGGALLNDRGQVVGVICAYYVDWQNLNIAVASNVISSLLERTSTQTTLQKLYIAQSPQLAFDSGYYACVRTISLSTYEKAQQLYSDWLDSDGTEDSIISIFDKYGPTQGGGKLHFVLPGEWVDEADQWCFDPSRRIGDFAVMETVYGYTFCYFSDAIREGEWFSYWISAALKEQFKRGDFSQSAYEDLLKILYQADSSEEYSLLEKKYRRKNNID